MHRNNIVLVIYRLQIVRIEIECNLNKIGHFFSFLGGGGGRFLKTDCGLYFLGVITQYFGLHVPRSITFMYMQRYSVKIKCSFDENTTNPGDIALLA